MNEIRQFWQIRTGKIFISVFALITLCCACQSLVLLIRPPSRAADSPTPAVIPLAQKTPTEAATQTPWIITQIVTQTFTATPQYTPTTPSHQRSQTHHFRPRPHRTGNKHPQRRHSRNFDLIKRTVSISSMSISHLGYGARTAQLILVIGESPNPMATSSITTSGKPVVRPTSPRTPSRLNSMAVAHGSSSAHHDASITIINDQMYRITAHDIAPVFPIKRYPRLPQSGTWFGSVRSRVQISAPRQNLSHLAWMAHLADHAGAGSKINPTNPYTSGGFLE